MKLKALYLMAGLLVAGPTLADFTNGPNPYAAGYGFDAPSDAAWGWWTRGDAGTIYAEWDTFVDSSYPGARTAAPDVPGKSGVTDAYASWSVGTFTAGSGNLYSFSAPQSYTFNVTGTAISGPVRAVVQTETWGTDFVLSSVKLNGVAPTLGAETYVFNSYPSPLGNVTLKHRLFYWDLASAPTSYAFSLASGMHQSLAQVSVDIAAVPEPGTYAMLAAGLGLLGLQQLRRRNKSEHKVA